MIEIVDRLGVPIKVGSVVAFAISFDQSVGIVTSIGGLYDVIVTSLDNTVTYHRDPSNLICIDAIKEQYPECFCIG